MANHKPKRKKTVVSFTETPERRRHAYIEDHPTDQAGVTGRRVSPPIERLLARGSISGRMFSAGQALQKDYEIGVCGGREGREETVPGIRSTGMTITPSEIQIDALTAYKRALRCLGEHLAHIVVAVCCYERDVSIAAGQIGQDRQEVMGVLKAGLKTLADHYRLAGADHYAQPTVDMSSRRVG